MPYTNKEAAREAQLRWKAANRDRVNAQARAAYAANPGRQKESTKRWRDKNLDKAREKSRRWNAANKPRTREADRRWRKNNPERAQAKVARWNNSEKGRAAVARRRIKLGLPPPNPRFSRLSEEQRTARQEQARINHNIGNELWRKNNPEKQAKLVSAWQKANPEKVRTKSLRWHKTHPEQSKAAHARWVKENPDKQRSINRNRRARKKRARGTCSAEQTHARISLYGGLCAYCRRRPHEHLDHVIPLSRGGTNWPANLRPACVPCNGSKGTKLLSEWTNRP